MNKIYLWLCFRLSVTDAMRILLKTTFLFSPHICYEFVCVYTNDRMKCGDRDKKFIYCLHARTRKRTHTRIQ